MKYVSDVSRKSLHLFAIVTLAMVLVGALTLAVWATVTTVNIDSPTAGSPVYKQSVQNLTIQYDANGTGAGQVNFYIAGNLQATDDVTFPLTDATKVLPLGGIGAGTWDVKVEAKETGQANWTSDTEIGALVVDNTNPTIQVTTLTSPNGGQSWAAGSVHAITWNSAHITDANLGSIPISLELSTDGGGSYSQFVTGLANSGSYNWTVPGAVTSNAKVKIVATDLAGNFDLDMSGAVFSIYGVDNTPPVVALTAPADGAWVAGAAVVVSANASDPESGIAQVQFQYDSGNGWTDYAADTTSPYSVNWNTTVALVPPVVDGGAVDWQAIATNGGAAQTTSAKRTFKVDNSTPAVTLDAPAAGDFVRGTVTLQATANDVDSGITQVEFFRGPAGGVGPWTSIGIDTSNTYTLTWDTTAVADGIYDLKATATNWSGLTPYAINLNVTVDNTPPAVPTLTSPNGGEVWNIDTAQQIKWNALPADPSLLPNPVTLFVQPGGGWVQIGPAGGFAAASPFNWIVAGMPSAQAKVKIVVTDKSGNTADDVSNNFFTLWGSDATGPDTYTLVKPTAGNYKGTVALEALAGDSVSGIQKVEFFYQKAGTTTWTSIGLGSSPSGVLGLLPKTYTAAWNTALVADASYTVKVVATNGVGTTAEAQVAGVIVDNTAPTVSLDAPKSCEYVAGGAVNVQATANDPTAGIAKVDFYWYDASLVPPDWVFIGTDAGAPYQVPWNTAGLAGAVNLKAVATDNSGNPAEDSHSVIVDALVASQHQINLVANWNLVSLEAAPNLTNVDTLWACVVGNGSMDWIQTFDATLAPLKWDPGTPIHSLTDMYDGRAHWVAMFEAADFTFTERAPGTGSPPSYNVVPGWNFIGFTRTAADTPASYLGAVAAHVQAMYGWNSGAQTYYAVGAGNLTPDEGYWMALDAPGTIYP